MSATLWFRGMEGVWSLCGGGRRFGCAEGGAGVGLRDAVAQADAGLPAQRFHPRDVEQLAGRAVGLAAVEDDAALVADDVHDGFGELADGHVRPCPDVEQRIVDV